ncbi:pilus assembly protein, partial [Paenibacillus odorifer]
DGSLSSGHSNSAHDMVSRLETMVLSAAELPVAVVRQQISSAIDIFVHLSRLRDRSRRVMEISEVAGLKDGEVILNPLYEFQEAGEREGRVQGGLLPCGNPLLHTTKLRMAGVNSYPLAQ